jgi:phosphohistidine phosphatase
LRGNPVRHHAFTVPTPPARKAADMLARVRLVLLRHATAAARGSSDPDSERPLVAEGEAEARHAGRALRRLGMARIPILTSPFVRATGTARLAAAELESEVKVDPALEPGFGPGELRRLVRGRNDDALLLVGHDPDFSELVGALSGARVRLPKCGAASIDLEAGELRWLLRPKHLRLVARAS